MSPGENAWHGWDRLVSIVFVFICVFNVICWWFIFHFFEVILFLFCVAFRLKNNRGKTGSKNTTSPEINTQKLICEWYNEG